ncbi:glycosyltransferase family 39 protein [Candidatus Woesearchaeota archaeon]|nr:glycosyltransferase family 39 protein [Candidatus Woesearchaeota archaeon]
MGKYIFSLGKIGLWEPARPLLWPILMGFVWKIGLNALLFSSLINILLASSSIYLLYELINCLNDDKTALLFCFLFSINISIIYFTNKMAVDIAAMFLSLLAFYFLIKKQRFLLSGIFMGLAVLTKFTYLWLIPILILGCLIEKKDKIKKSVLFMVGFSVLIIPFLISNIVLYNNLFAPFIFANDLISRVVGNYYCPTSAFFYISNLLITSFIIILAVIPILLAFKHPLEKKNIFLLAFLVPFLYHSFMLNCKDMRYSLIFLPFLYILSGSGFEEVSKILKKPLRYALISAIILQSIISLAGVSYALKRSPMPAEYKAFYSYLEGRHVKGDIWSSTPVISAVHDIKIDELMYYEVWDNKRIEELSKKTGNNIQYIFINSCDLPCVRYDPDCPERSKKFFSLISESFELVFNSTVNGCELKIYQEKK